MSAEDLRLGRCTLPATRRACPSRKERAISGDAPTRFLRRLSLRGSAVSDLLVRQELAALDPRLPAVVPRPRPRARSLLLRLAGRPARGAAAQRPHDPSTRAAVSL